MTISKLIAACGLCVALGTASAQTDRPATQPGSTTSPTTTSSGSTTTGMTDTRSMLKKLEGNWKVDVSVNTSLWNPHLFKDVNDKNPSNINDAPRDRSAPARNPDQSNDRPADRTDADRTNKDKAVTSDGMKTFSGYTRNELILGDVLQQTTYMPDLSTSMHGNDMPRNKDGEKYNEQKDTRKPSSSDSMAGDGKFKGVSLLSFDESSKTYSMVFLSNCEDEMHLKNGTFTTSGNQIVFHGSADHSGSRIHGTDSRYNTNTPGSSTTPGSQTGSSPTSQPNSTPNTAPGSTPGSQPATRPDTTRPTDTTPGNPNNPSMNPDSRTVQPSRTADGMHKNSEWKNTMSGCQVVIDIISPDEHRVTMYATEGPVVSAPTTPGNPGRLDSTPPDNASGINRNEPTTGDPKIAMTAGKVVYRAVFRRATGDEIARTREATRLTEVPVNDNR